MHVRHPIAHGGDRGNADGNGGPGLGSPSPARDSRPLAGDGGRAAGSGAHRLDLRVRQRRRVDPLLVGLRGGRRARRVSRPVAIPRQCGRPTRDPVAQPEPGSRHREDRRRPRDRGVRRHPPRRRARLEALADSAPRGRRDPARLPSRRPGRLGVRPELQHPGVDDRLDRLRPRGRRPGLPAALGARPGLGAGGPARARPPPRPSCGSRRSPGSRVAFCEVVYSADRTTDTRTVYLLELGCPVRSRNG